MIWRLSRDARKARREADQAQRHLDSAKERRDEVSELASWAREARQRNHLTDLFYRGLTGGGSRG